MRRASPSPGPPFSVLTGPTSGSLRWPVLHFFHTLAGRPLQPCECRCDLSGKDLCALFDQTQGLGGSCSEVIFFRATNRLRIFP